VKKHRRIFMFIIAAALATVLFSLPLLLSLGPVVQYGLTLLNREFAGTLEVESCSLGWQQGLRCRGVIYEHPRQGLRLDAPEVSSDKGVLALLAAPRYLGTFILDQPVVTLNLPGKERQPHSDFHDQELTSVGAKGSEKPWWERTTLRLSVNHGIILVDSEDGSRQALASEIQLEGSLADGIFNYALDFISGLEQEGSLRIQGHINLPPSRGPLGETLISRAEVEIRDMDIAPFFAAAASRSDLPQGTGRLEATCTLRTAGLKDLAIIGTADLRDVRFFGGVLGPDQPQVDALHITFNGERDLQAGWRLNTFSLQSEALRMEASGLYDQAAVLLSAEGTVDLQMIAAQIPYFFDRHEKTRIKEGAIGFSLEMSGTVRDVPLPSPAKDGRVVVRDLVVADGWQGFVDAGQEVAWINVFQRQLGVQRLHVRGERASAQVTLWIDDVRQPLPFQDIVVEVRLHDTVTVPEANIEAMQEAIQAQLAVAIQPMSPVEGEGDEIDPGTGLDNTQQEDQE
jgi:hypothetical protein